MSNVRALIMFNWIQHLFTARALQSENINLSLQLSDAKKRISDMETQLDEYKQIIAVEKEKLAACIKSHKPIQINPIPTIHHWPKPGS